MKCDGPPGLGQTCSKRGTEVQMCQGDMMLCLECEHDRFPEASRLFFQSRNTDGKNRRTKSSSLSAASVHPVAENLVVNIPNKTTEPVTERHCKEDCKHKGEERGEMIRCSMCFKWFHLQCVGLKKNNSDFQYWPCENCKLTGTRLKHIEQTATDLQKTIYEMNERFSVQNDLFKEVINTNVELQNRLMSQLEINEHLQMCLTQHTQELSQRKECLVPSVVSTKAPPTATPVIQGEVLVDHGSSFQGFCTSVSTIEQVYEAIRTIKALLQCRLATHVMMAYRLNGPVVGPKESCQDDGEQHAGGHLLRVLQQKDITDVIVVVCRWYGGVHLGTARFTRITGAAQNALSKLNTSSNQGKSTVCQRKKYLLLGNSLIRDINDITTDDGQEVITKKVSGAKFSDLTRALGDFDGNSISGVHLITGTRDVDSDTPIDSVKEDSRTLIAKAKDMFDQVVVSSVIPRIDRDVIERQQTINDALSQTCQEQGITFINHDNNFLFRNSDVDSSSFMNDGVHLSSQGTAKLMSNLHLKPATISATPAALSDAWKKPPRSIYRPPSGPSGPRRPVFHDQRKSYTSPRHRTIPPSQGRCWFCGEPGHTQQQCGHGKQIQCMSCNNYGHKAKFCQY